MNEITEFERVPDMPGYYISSNAPKSGEFVQIENVRDMIEQAYMAGQCDEGIDPSYSNAQLYANDILNESKWRK